MSGKISKMSALRRYGDWLHMTSFDPLWTGPKKNWKWASHREWRCFPFSKTVSGRVFFNFVKISRKISFFRGVWSGNEIIFSGKSSVKNCVIRSYRWPPLPPSGDFLQSGVFHRVADFDETAHLKWIYTLNFTFYRQNFVKSFGEFCVESPRFFVPLGRRSPSTSWLPSILNFPAL